MDLFKIAEDFYSESKFAEAHHFFKKALTETPNNQLIFPYIVTTAILTKEFDKVDHYVSFYFKSYLITDIFAIEQEFEDEEFWEYLIEEITNNKVQLSHLSNLVLRYFEGEYEARLKLLDEFIPTSPTEKYWQCAFFLNIYTSQNRKEADIKLEECLSINSKCPLPWFLRHFSQHELENTSYYLDKAVEMKPDYWEALKENTRGYFNDHEYESYPKAIKLCDNIIFLNPPKELLTWSLGIKARSFLALDKYREAIISFNQSLQLDDEQIDLYLYRGSTKNRMKDYIGALRDYEKFLNLEDEYKEIDPIIYIVIGTLHLRLNQYHEAIKYYTDVIERKAYFSIVYLRRAAAFSAINQKMLAEADIREANKIILSKQDFRNNLNYISNDEL
jgi:tetratricopeptide (TPR) repeat protein